MTNLTNSALENLFDSTLVAAQQPQWPDKSALDQAVAELKSFPPLVFAGECDELKSRIAQAARGEAFWLQGGDCAETFTGATADSIRNRIKTILQMAAVLQYGASLPVVKVGRMAGQFAKPRSKDTEVRDGITLPAYRGDAVNDLAFDERSRTPDPNRLVKVYHTSAMTLNLVRAFTQGGFADLRRVHEWNKGFIRDAAFGERYEQMANEIGRALAFMKSAGIDAELRSMLTLAGGNIGTAFDNVAEAIKSGDPKAIQKAQEDMALAFDQMDDTTRQQLQSVAKFGKGAAKQQAEMLLLMDMF